MRGLSTRSAVMVFMLPPLALYFFAVLLPIGQSLVLSLFSWDGITSMRFVGLQNYVQMLTNDGLFWTAFRNSLVFVAINLVLQLGLGLCLAELLTHVYFGRETIKTLFFLPTIITTVAIAFLFQRMYAFEPPGVINLVLRNMGLGGFAIPWLSDFRTALAAVSVPEAWRFMGLYMVILYAALLAVPQELEEAARIDGASGWQVFRHVRFPLIRPVWGATLIMAATYSLRGFDIPYLLTNGGPGESTELLPTYMYKTAFTSLEFGYSSTIAVFIVVESVVAVLLIRRVWRSSGNLA